MGWQKRDKDDYEARVASIAKGREGRDKFGSKKGQRKLEKHSSSTNFEKKKGKNFMMSLHSTSVRSKKSASLRDKQRKCVTFVGTSFRRLMSFQASRPHQHAEETGPLIFGRVDAPTVWKAISLWNRQPKGAQPAPSGAVSVTRPLLFAGYRTSEMCIVRCSCQGMSISSAHRQVDQDRVLESGSRSIVCQSCSCLHHSLKMDVPSSLRDLPPPRAPPPRELSRPLPLP
jgi:hypothetical protein